MEQNEIMTEHGPIRNKDTQCSVCWELKGPFGFTYYAHRKTKDGCRLMVNTNCKVCAGKRSKELRKILKKFKHLKRPPFGDPCESCEKPVHRNWQLDHDHETGKFRGWLCKQCNTGIGSIGDTLDAVEKMRNYLIRAEQKKNKSQLLLKEI
mgnify:CR=1 FL=1